MKDQILILLIISIAIVAIIIYCTYGYKISNTKSEPSLYTRLGGIFPISAVVNHFSDALLTNKIVGVNSKNPYLRDWNRNKAPTRLQGLKFMRTLWLASIAGGPYIFTSTKQNKCPFSLENVHKDLQISPEEFDAVAQELNNSLDYYNVPSNLKQEVLQAFKAHKGDIVFGYDIAHNITPPKIIC